MFGTWKGFVTRGFFTRARALDPTDLESDSRGRSRTPGEKRVQAAGGGSADDGHVVDRFPLVRKVTVSVATLNVPTGEVLEVSVEATFYR